jgi:hypothetical protein
VRHEQLGMLVYSPLAGGFVSGKFGRNGVTDAASRRAHGDLPPIDRERGYNVVDVLRKVAARLGTGVPGIALAWVLAQPGVTSVVVGARRPDQLTENVAATEVELTERTGRGHRSAAVLPGVAAGRGLPGPAAPVCLTAMPGPVITVPSGYHRVRIKPMRRIRWPRCPRSMRDRCAADKPLAEATATKLKNRRCFPR